MIQSFEKVQLVTNVPSGDLKMICSDFEKLKMKLKKWVCCRRGKENYTEKYFFVEKNIPTWHKKYVQLVWVPRERKNRGSRSVQIAIALSMVSKAKSQALIKARGRVIASFCGKWKVYLAKVSLSNKKWLWKICLGENETRRSTVSTPRLERDAGNEGRPILYKWSN